MQQAKAKDRTALSPQSVFTLAGIRAESLQPAWPFVAVPSKRNDTQQSDNTGTLFPATPRCTATLARCHQLTGLAQAPGLALAWDAGCGNGQASLGLATHFERVVATDSSAQL